MASKIFTSQDWRLICDTEEDQTTATGLLIYFKAPAGIITSKAATLDTNVNRIYTDIGVDELTENGDWKVWPKTTIGGNVAPGDPAILTIHEEGT